MQSHSLERVNFLIVDDNKAMRHLVETVLKALGAVNILEATNGAEAFAEMANFPADIVICDWNMQPMDGIAFTREMRTGADSPNRYVPIILLTGHTELSRVREARDVGVNEFLAKPISATSIYSRIKSIIERPRQFVRSPEYFGPDRRRRDLKEYPGPFRRATDAESSADGNSVIIG
ncbi:response regulator [Alphaproteobacteria bacterium HT1-32]|nr:response regulator [Alphaproteobacteria bacterium HT1-32]